MSREKFAERASGSQRNQTQAGGSEGNSCIAVYRSRDLGTRKRAEISGGYTIRGTTRSHTEHDGQALVGRRYFAGDGTGE